MKNILKSIAVLLISIASSSYTMGDKSGFDAGMGIGFSAPSISVPRLGDQPEEQRAEHEARQSSLEQLALELARNALSSLSASQIKNVALVSRQCRVQAQFSITHLTIPLEDITEEKLKDVECRFPNIKSLAIKAQSWQKITPEHIKLLAQKFPHIQSLDLSSTHMTAEEVLVLSQPDVFKDLKRLNLAWNQKIKNEGIAALAKASFANQLEFLNLNDAFITKTGMMVLTQPDAFKALKQLYLRWNQIGASAIADLIKAPFAGQLDQLDLYGTSITKAEKRDLLELGISKNIT